MTDINAIIDSQTNINATVTQLPDINVSLDIVGSTTLNGINDVLITNPQNNDHFIYNSTNERWENNPSSASIVWGDITGTLSNQTDLDTALGLKADDSDLTSHTGTTTIHFTEGSISIPASQISDFDTEVSNNSSVSANTSKDTNISTDLSEGTSTETTVDVNSSDGTNATLVSASATRAGLLTKAKFDEIVVNNAKVSSRWTANGNNIEFHNGDVSVIAEANEQAFMRLTSFEPTSIHTAHRTEGIGFAFSFFSGKMQNDVTTADLIRFGAFGSNNIGGTPTLTYAFIGDDWDDNAIRIFPDKDVEFYGDVDLVGGNLNITGNITVSGTVDGIDIATDVAANTNKETNATHTGDVTGSTALTLATVNSNVGSFTNADITINAKGLITAASSGSGGGITWNEVTGTTQSASVDNGYITNNASLVTVTLPDTAVLGSTLRIAGLGAGGWKLAQNASELIYFGNSTTTTGTGGSLASTLSKDSIELVCVVANTEWSVISSVGNITIV